MFAVTAARIDSADPLSGLELGDRPDPGVPEGWTTVRLKAASLNHHDLWSLRGVGLRADRLPMVLGTDGAGLDEDGNEVVIHAVIGDPDRGGGDETLDPQRSLLSEIHATTSANVPAWISESSERCGSRVSSPPPRSGSPITAWMTTSLPSWSSPAPSVPSTIGSRSARRPTPRRLHRSWWLSDAAFSRTVVQPSGTPGSGRSPSSKPDSGSAESMRAAVTANIAAP